MEFVEDLGAKVNKCSYINEYINFISSPEPEALGELIV